MCSSCGRPFAADADPRRTTCSPACRSKSFRDRDRLRRVAIDLALAQTLAIISGNRAALAQVIADADRLLPAV